MDINPAEPCVMLWLLGKFPHIQYTLTLTLWLIGYIGGNTTVLLGATYHPPSPLLLWTKSIASDNIFQHTVHGCHISEPCVINVMQIALPCWVSSPYPLPFLALLMVNNNIGCRKHVHNYYIICCNLHLPSPLLWTKSSR